MKINKIFCIAITLIIVFSLTACGGVSNTTENNDGIGNNNVLTNDLNESNSDEADRINDGPVYLIAMSEAINTSDKFKDAFKDAEQYGVYCSPNQEEMENMKGHTFKDPISNQTLEYSCSRCYYRNNLPGEYGTHYSIYDSYRNKDTSIDVLRGTDLICFYFNRNDDREVLEVQFTDEEARSIADMFVISVVGNDIFSAFDLDYVKKDTLGMYAYLVCYTRKTNGHKTDEIITVFVGKSGKVIGYNGSNVCKYETLTEQFDDEKINSAKVLLTDKINSLDLKYLETDECIITCDVDGVLYVMLDFSYTDEYGMDCAATAYTKV